MPDLHLIGVHEDGEHLLLSGRGGQEFRLPIDDTLRALLRREYAQARTDAEPMRPTEVQAMIRAGASAQEAAERAGWSVEKVHRYEGPILAERAHIARLAGDAHVPTHGSDPVTLGERVERRLESRGVPSEQVEWDSWRSEDGQWTVELGFPAGGRRRVASWFFSRSGMTVTPVDDEARWLTGDDSPGQPQAPRGRTLPTRGAAQEWRQENAQEWQPEAPQEWDHDAGRDPVAGHQEHRPERATGASRGETLQADRARRDVYQQVGHEQVLYRQGSAHPGAQHQDRAGQPGTATPGAGRGESEHTPDGGRAASRPARGAGAASPQELGRPERGRAVDPDSELMSDLRERAAQRGRRRPRRLPSGGRGARAASPTASGTTDSGTTDSGTTDSVAPPAGPTPPTAAGTAPTDIPDVGVAPDPEAVPLEPLDYDPQRDGLPPAAHANPAEDGPDGRPEPAAADLAPAAPDLAPAAPDAAPAAADAAEAGAAPASAPSDDAAITEATSESSEHGTAEQSTAAAEPVQAEEARRSTGVRSQARHTEPELPLGEVPPEAAADDAAQGTPEGAAVQTPTESTGSAADPSVGEVPEILDSPGLSDTLESPETPGEPADQPPAAAADTKAAEAAEQPEAQTSETTPAASAKPAARKRTRTRRTSGGTATAPADAAADDDSRGAATQPAATKPTATKPTAPKPAAPKPAAAKSTPSRTAAPKSTGPAKEPAAGDEAATKRPPQRSSRRGRASVPAWDDIMFGAKHPED
ncbi:hypothetical protein BJY21_000147 [Kineosphaera limosa]|uniref:DUF3071 domain-containing protein n=1 Tax=Kineosphaera limosa NBRC 100340 TaxID=1184609 RepID=K6X0G0_9MICO|nr:septation protein SepH [Kineosphaera limosa]NYD98962.1 hypothetical protein [Kineosphaera limosa]GAB97817.1 hypothetical protein KILIM_083_00130 [Kineosphaera limosa NBRC 100340]